jgi:hypothetical protein
MAEQTTKPMKIGTEITVRISLTFQEAPDVHTLLAMTPVRERGKLVRLALERYIAEIGHPAGDVEQQIHAISTWLRSRTSRSEATVCAAYQLEVDHAFDAESALQVHDVPTHPLPRSGLSAGAVGRSDSVSNEVDATSTSIRRWLQA